MIKISSFSLSADHILRVLSTQAEIGPPLQPTDLKAAALKSYLAIWDTGATGTVITQKVVDDLGLKATGMVKVHGVQGEHTTETFMVCVKLPNKVGFRSV